MQLKLKMKKKINIDIQQQKLHHDLKDLSHCHREAHFTSWKGGSVSLVLTHWTANWRVSDHEGPRTSMLPGRRSSVDHTTIAISVNRQVPGWSEEVVYRRICKTPPCQDQDSNSQLCTWEFSIMSVQPYFKQTQYIGIRQAWNETMVHMIEPGDPYKLPPLPLLSKVALLRTVQE